MAARRERVPFVFRALDVSHRIRKGLYSSLVRRAEQLVYRNADFLSANNPAMHRYCSSMGARLETMDVHYPPLDLTMFQNGNRKKGRTFLGVGEDVHVSVYLGSFFYFSGLDSVVRSWGEANSDGTLVLIGFGEQEEMLRSLVAKLGLDDRVLFTGAIAFNDLPDLLAAADLGINPMQRSLVSDTALPNKVLQYLAAGLPVATTPLDGLVATFNAWPGVTWLDSPEDVGNFAAQSFRNKARIRHGHVIELNGMFGSEAVESFEEFLTIASRPNK